MSKAIEYSLAEFDETIRVVLDSGGEFRMYPKGTSMLPLLRQNIDSVVLEKPKGALKRGDIAFYQRDNGAYVLHRVIRAKGDSYIMCGDHQIIPEHGIEQQHIIGVVTRIYRGEKCLSLNGLRYKTYELLWRSFFVRRVFFKLWRGKDDNV